MEMHFLEVLLPFGPALTVLIVGVKGETFHCLWMSCKRHVFPFGPYPAKHFKS